MEERLPYYLTSRCWKTDLLRFPGNLTFWAPKQRRCMWEEKKRLKRIIFYVLSGSRNIKLFFRHSKLLLSHIQLFYDPMDCSPPVSFVYGIPPARILEWVALPLSGGSSRLKRNDSSISCVACTAGGSFTTELQGKPTEAL